jgi:hypothetical protein
VSPSAIISSMVLSTSGKSLRKNVLAGALGSLGLIGSEEFVCCVELSGMVPELLLFTTH